MRGGSVGAALQRLRVSERVRRPRLLNVPFARSHHFDIVSTQIQILSSFAYSKTFRGCLSVVGRSLRPRSPRQPREPRFRLSTTSTRGSTSGIMEQRTAAGSKRKANAVPSRRPTKLNKVEALQEESSSDEMLLDGSETNSRNGTIDSRVLPLAAPADSMEWQNTIERVVKSVVSIRFSQTCSFDTDHASMSEATGFVVDNKEGYILTNRHVVSAGPFWGYCVFDNHEECDVYPVYRDPVHDFGILRFDPKEIKYMPVEALELRPELAAVGAEIRVVGNDAGEKLSILSGVISRIDRNAPEYGDGYNDFNTNYIQAAASASGGSSGSPVVNVDGYAIALQAGGSTEAATDYFLPLDRPQRALKCIQRGREVSRGTIQTQWLIKPFDECRRLGLTAAWEAVARESNPREIGMLVAEIILPEGPADNFIEEGDILIKINDELVTRFIRLEEILDSSVDKAVKILVQRGGEDIEFTIRVGDLHAISPDRFLTVSGASFHDLSYQQARLYAIAVKGVYVCEPSGSFRFDGADRGWIVESIDNEKTPNLKAFIEVMTKIPDRARIVMNYRHLRDLHTLHTSIVTIDRHWTSKMRLAIRNDKTGLWDFESIGEALPPVPSKRSSANFIRMASTEYPAPALDVVRSFVKLVCTFPVKLDGFPYARKVGFGLVVDAEQGLVLVSRTIVPFDLCDIQMTFADSIMVEGKVIFMHPLLNFAIIKYDPSLVDAPVLSANLSAEHIRQGDTKIFLGYNHNSRVVVSRTTIPDVTTVAIPSNPAAPRYRAINFDAITVDTQLSTQCGCGVLLNDDGSIQGIWHTYLGERQGTRDVEYHLGINAASMLPVIRKIQSGTIPELRMLSAEFHTVPMSQARIMGVSEDWIRKVEAASPDRHQFFLVSKVDCGQRDQALEESDIVLAVNGQVLTRISELDVMYDSESVQLTIVRKCQEMTINVPTYPTSGLETDRAVIFCGAILHRPHLAVRQSIIKLHSQIYVSARIRGSPAYQYALMPTNFIVAVNGVKVTDLTDFVREVVKIPDNTYFRLRVVTFDNIPFVLTIKKNEHYFPMMEFVKDPSEPCGWKRLTYENGFPHSGLENPVVAENMEAVPEAEEGPDDGPTYE